jgi:formylglycine-generating enzyme required for sulfatase activity
LDNRIALPKDTLLDGSYLVVRVIAAGGFGVTYEAEDVKLHTRVALKEYYPADFGERDNTMHVRPKSASHRKTFEWGRSSFLQEAQTLARFRHSSIVRVTRVFEAFSTAYMVMEYEHGRDFDSWLRALKRAPTQEELDRIVAPLLDALELMHAKNFLHRDIAPDNIIIREDGTPVLLDFGAARRAVAEMTKTLTGIVKSGYSPHEQYATDGRLQGPWSDLYAFGATLYRAVTGKPPEEATLRVTDDRVLPAAEAVVGTYRPGFLSAIDTCLRIRPADRPQLVAQLRPLLFAPVARVVTRAVEARKMPTVTPARALTWPGRNTRWWAGAVVGAVVAIGAGVYGGYEYARQRKTVATDRKNRQEASSSTKQTISPVPATVRCDGVEAQVGNDKRCLKPKESFTDCFDCPEMVVVPAGSFIMGSPPKEPERFNDEAQVRVSIAAPFAAGKYAVTFDEWDACVADRGCNGYKPNDQGWGRGKHPVINVNWEEAKAYAAWLSRKTGKSYRLLSEAEREYVTRAGTQTPFWWGSAITPTQANYDGNYTYAGGGSKGENRRRTVPVDSFEPNPWGFYNVHGNVSEWTEDCWNDTNSGNPGDDRAKTTGTCTQRVARGGSWLTDPGRLRSAARGGRFVDDRFSHGFRLARTLGP